jgi:two-component system, NtrC family, sensor kinase
MLKRYLLLFAIVFLFLSPGAFAQVGRVFNLNKLSKQDTLLSGWKIHAGDDPKWTKPDLDDNRWQSGDPGKDVTELMEIHQTGICWIRLHIKVDSGIAKQQLTAWVFQYTASEIYLDGKLIKSYGTINSSPSKTIALCPAGDLFRLLLKPGAEHVIAVRLAYQSGLPYSSPYFTPLSAFSLYVNDFHTAFVNYQLNEEIVTRNTMLSVAFAGMFFIITFIYLFYYLFDRKQKVHLYYALLTVFAFSLNLAFSLFVNSIQSVAVQSWMSFSIAISFVLASLFILLTEYSLFGYEKRIYFKALAIIGAGFVGYVLISDILGFVFATNIFMAVCTLEGIRVSIIAIKRQKRGAVSILLGLAASLILNIWSGVMDQSTFLSLITALLAILGFPLGMSVYLATQNATTNQLLRKSLEEVETLSQQKQQILADQNILLETQVNERTAELNQSLTHLKATQTQLIQSEKMASLGELTAGIAHEIQNPLNFVNNFSEINTELVGEMKQEIDKGDLEEIRAIATDIEENSKKINMHGKRADAIVKGMLQHSQSGSGAKEPTNINALAEECMRLAYHGLRAKDASFTAEMVSHLDETLPKVNVIPQDIVRVMLNLFNNAFYAVNQKAKTAEVDYKPEVSVTTYTDNGQVVIKVADNGTGMPDSIKEKIMQPFFTTKPTGEGTGLGLSLSYDIVVKGHGGSIDIETREGEYALFTIKLPVQ